jgi:hypothetical protein
MSFAAIIRSIASFSLLCSAAHGFASNLPADSHFGLKNAAVSVPPSERLFPCQMYCALLALRTSRLIHPFLVLHCSIWNTPQQQHGCITTLRAVTHDASSRFFQLEELEDRYSCVTEIFLKTDKTVDVFETDGPIPSESWGTWEQSGDFFVLNFQRTFRTGRKGTDMGEFSYSVERSFVGEMTMVGGQLAVKGSIHSVDDLVGDRQVGFFSMLDTTKIKLGLEKGEEKKGRVSYAS